MAGAISPGRRSSPAGSGYQRGREAGAGVAVGGRESRDGRPEAELDGRGGARLGPLAAAGAASEARLLTALLPLRFFVGLTFLYAGVSKFLDPRFLRNGGPGSIGEQLSAFMRTSPLAPLIQAVALPHPVAMGGLIALGEVAIGLGVTLGLFYRWAALGGFGVGMLFFLTASWSTQPYYYGPDLPYAAGFLTLALVGRPGPYGLGPTLEAWFEPAPPRRSRRDGRQRATGRASASAPEDGFSPGRRALLQAGAIGVTALAIGGLAYVFGRTDESPASLVGAATPAGSSSLAGGGVGGSAGASAGSNVIGTMSQLNQQGQLDFTDPSTGDPAIAVDVGGSVAAYDATCTHQGCPVQYYPSQKIFACPCHGAEYDASRQAAVIAGPAPSPLRPIAVHVDGQGNVILG